jgi:hypothetical protein
LTQYIPEGGIEAQLKFEDDSDAEGEFGAEKGTDAPAAAW